MTKTNYLEGSLLKLGVMKRQKEQYGIVSGVGVAADVEETFYEQQSPVKKKKGIKARNTNSPTVLSDHIDKKIGSLSKSKSQSKPKNKLLRNRQTLPPQ